MSHVYLSPCLQAFPGSMHGYDVTDPGHISADLGGEAAWQSFVEAARAQHLGILLDFVPNHMSASQHNPWWDDVLAHGPYSEFAGLFRHPQRRRTSLSRCTSARWRTPMASRSRRASSSSSRAAAGRGSSTSTTPGRSSAASWGTLLDDRIRASRSSIGLQGVVAPSDAERARHRREIERAEAVLAEAAAAGRLDAAIERTREDPARLDAILRRQFFALHSWKLAGELTNYRRFFDVSGLVGIKIEMPAVFEAAHARIEADDPAGAARRLAARPSGRTAGSARLLRAAAGIAAGWAAVRREDPRERRAACRRTGPSTAPSATSSWPR